MSDVFKKPVPRTVQRTIRLPRELDRDLAKLAESAGSSVPFVITEIVKRWAQEHPSKVPSWRRANG